MTAERPTSTVLVAIAASASLLLAIVGSIWMSAEALEERGVVSAAVEVHLAVKTVVASDALRSAGSDESSGAPLGLRGAVEILEGNLDEPLHSLDNDERTRATALIAEAAARGRELLEPGSSAVAPENHRELQALLDTGRARAVEDAAEASLAAVVALILAALTAALAAWLLLRARSREAGLRSRLSQQANTDYLTGLANRRRFGWILRHLRRSLEEGSGAVAIVALDLDGFKSINDLLGHAAGDEVLQEVADRLKAVAGESDHLVRLGGDEFAVAMAGLPDAEAAQALAGRYRDVFDEPFSIDGRMERLFASVGLATTDDPDEVHRLIGEADRAMYQAKRSSTNQIVVFDPTLVDESQVHAAIAHSLRSADLGEEFHLVYQPIVGLHDEEPIAHEALLRWTSPDLGPVGPVDFIPVAERNGQICDIGRMVLGEICRQLAEWNAGPGEPIAVSWNVSPRQLAEPAFVPGVFEALAAAGVDPGQLVVEVTESTVIDAEQATDRLAELRAGGVRIAIDDFGSGYSNLGQLLDVPIDWIKIDRSLLVKLTEMRETMGGDPSQPCAIMGGIVSIASIFQAVVVCEGVETELQRESLLRSGVGHGQGYLFGRPQPPTQVGVAPSRGDLQQV